jgi:hypothetical protein
MNQPIPSALHRALGLAIDIQPEPVQQQVDAYAQQVAAQQQAQAQAEAQVPQGQE